MQLARRHLPKIPRRLSRLSPAGFPPCRSNKFSVLVGTESGEGEGASDKFRNRIKAGRHTLVADEPEKLGGGDAGLSPYDLLLSALGACTSMTLRMYAERKKIPLEGVCVELEHKKIYLKDCEECVSAGISAESRPQGKGKKEPKVDVFERSITLHGNALTEKDRKNLLRIADMCPVHRTLEAKSVITTVLKEEKSDDAEPSSSSSSSSSHATLLAHLTAKSHSLTPDRPDFKVRRLIPVIAKRAVGPFVFVDHFGPVDVGASNSMDVGPHPHIGISTLTYLLSGAIVHRDSTGADATILPGEVNWMTAGKGVVHSERGNEALGQIKPDADGKKMLHGMQCWVGLPKEQEDIHPSFHHIDHHQTLDVSDNLREVGDVSGRLIVGRIPGSPEVEGIPHHWPMFMLDIELAKTSSVAIPIEENHELGVYVVQGRVASGSEEATLDVGDASIYTHEGKAKGAQSVRVKTLGEHARVVVFGGLPFPERRHMFWNFVATTKDTISSAATAWEAMDRGVFPKVVNEDNLDSIPLPPYRRKKT